MYSSFVSLGKFFPRYLIPFVTMVNGIDSLISLSAFKKKIIYFNWRLITLQYCIGSLMAWSPSFWTGKSGLAGFSDTDSDLLCFSNWKPDYWIFVCFPVSSTLWPRLPMAEWEGNQKEQKMTIVQFHLTGQLLLQCDFWLQVFSQTLPYLQIECMVFSINLPAVQLSEWPCESA